MSRRSQRGLSMLELMVVLMVFSVIILISIRAFADKALSNAREAAVARTAFELGVISRATNRWLANADETKLPPGASVQVALSTLITDGLLPQDFALRPPSNAVGTTPFGGTYFVRAYRSATGASPRAVAIATGATADRMERIGMQFTSGNERSVADDVATILQNKYSAISGVIDAGGTTIKGNFAGFSKDLQVELSSAPSSPAAAVLLGYPDTNPKVQNYKNPADSYGNCSLYPATVSGSGTCPAGTAEIASWVACNGIMPTDVRIMDSVMGKITFTVDLPELRDARAECGGGCSTATSPGAPPAACGAPASTAGQECGRFAVERVTQNAGGGKYDPMLAPLDFDERVSVSLNKSSIYRSICRTGRWTSLGAGAQSTVLISTARQAGFSDRLCCQVK